MRKNRCFVSLLCCLFIIVVQFPSFSFAQTKVVTPVPEERNGVIRVAFPKQFGFAQVDINGNLSGYTYDVLMKIAQRTGWKYEFVLYEFSNQGIMQSLTDLQEGKVDICGAMTYNEALGELYEFTKIPYGYSEYILLTDKNNAELNFRSLHSYPNLRIALVETATGQNNLVDTYFKEKGTHYTPVYAETSDACRELLEQGKADAFVSKNVVSHKDYKTIASLGEQPFYLAANKNNPQLVQQLDRIMEEINTTHPNYRSELFEQYFKEEKDMGLSLTAQEQAYLDTKPVLRATVLENAQPWQYYDQETGEFEGIIVDILRKITEQSGMEFQPVPVKTLEEAGEKLKNGEAEIISSLPAYFPLCEEYQVLMTSPLMDVPVVYLSTTPEKKKNEKILLSNEIAILDKKDDFTEMQDVEQIFSLVDKGEYAGAYVDGYTAQHGVAVNSYNNISLITLPYSSYNISIAVSQSCDIQVIRILEQAIANITNSQMEAIVYENITHRHETSLMDVIKRNPIETVCIISVISLVIIVLLATIYLRTQKLNKLISLEKNRYMEISKTDRLTHTYNNTTFKHMVASYLLESGGKPTGALLICDIDNFKKINDNYGHLTGDEVIAKLGEIMTKTFREDDIVGRLGGDEMVALVKGINEEDYIAKRCDEMLSQCQKISDKFQVTLSIGAVTFAEKSDFNFLFEKADEALYCIKNGSKNGYKIISSKTGKEG